MSNPYAPPSVNESKVGQPFLWRLAGYALIALGLIVPVIWMTLVGSFAIVLGGIVSLLILSAGIVMVALSLPAQTESEKRRKRLLLWLIPLLAILIIGGTLVVHTVRLTQQVQQARQEAMYQRDLARKAFEQAELQQRRSSEIPANE